MRKTMVILSCLCLALSTSTAFADVSGSSTDTGSWTSTGVYTSTITLSDPGGETMVTDVTVGVNIDHTWSSDVQMSLSDGTTTVLFNTGQGDSSNFGSSTVGTYFWNDAGSPLDDSGDNNFIIPSVAPPGFNTDASLNAGPWATSDATWTLTISDTVGGDGGFINGWSLDLVTAPAGIPEPTSFAVLGLVGIAAMTRRRKN